MLSYINFLNVSAGKCFPEFILSCSKATQTKAIPPTFAYIPCRTSSTWVMQNQYLFRATNENMDQVEREPEEQCLSTATNPIVKDLNIPQAQVQMRRADDDQGERSGTQNRKALHTTM